MTQTPSQDEVLSPNVIEKYDVYMSFIFPLNVYVSPDNRMNHYEAMTDKYLIFGAERMLEDVESIHRYGDHVVDALITIFASMMIKLGYHEPGSGEGEVDSTTKYTIRKTLPSKDCYKFINLLMTIYEIYPEDSLPENVYPVIEKWLLDNESTVKSSKKNS
jgi:hypothetical protein